MGAFSFWHILILAILVLLLFGGNKFSNMMTDIAKGMKSFKKGLAEDEEEDRPARRSPPRQVRDDRGEPIDITPDRDHDRTRDR